MIVSHKCTHNLFDLTNLWKRLVIFKMDQQVLTDNHSVTQVDEDSNVDMDIAESDSDSSHSDDDPLVHLLGAC